MEKNMIDIILLPWTLFKYIFSLVIWGSIFGGIYWIIKEHITWK